MGWARVRRDSLVAALFVTSTACEGWPGTGGGAPPVVTGGDRVEDTSGLLGSSCDGDLTPCTAGLVCVDALPGGMCSRACERDADCGGGVCAASNWGVLCFRSCAASALCRPGYECTDLGEASVCTPSTAESTVATTASGETSAIEASKQGRPRAR